MVKKRTEPKIKQTTEQTPKKKIFLIIGRTCSGKSSMTRLVCEEMNLRQVKSYTTRPAREIELKCPDKCDHYFITDDEVDQYVPDMAAYTEINGYKYFTTKAELDQCDCYVIDPNGAKVLMAKCGEEYDFVTIYVRRRLKDMERSFIGRGEDLQAFRERYKDEDAQFTAYEKAMTWDYHILNMDTLTDAAEKLQRIISKELNKKSEVNHAE